MMIGDKIIITTGVYGYNPRLYKKGEPVVTYEQPEQTEAEQPSPQMDRCHQLV